MVLVIDNYDSFTYNLVQYLGELGAASRVRRNDQITLDEIAAMAPEQIVDLTRPGTTGRRGHLVRRRFDALGRRRRFSASALGIRRLASCTGATSCRAQAPMHGKTSTVVHDGKGVFSGSAAPFQAGRYHSLVIAADSVPDELEVAARTKEDDTIMAVRHRTYPVHGVQFHPESVLTDEGRRFCATSWSC